MTNSWDKFYRERINSTYQDYFEDRYALFLAFIQNQKNDYIVEMGCGIGSVSKALLKRGFTCRGFDICDKMVDFSNENTGGQKLFYQGDIFEIQLPVDVLGVSHGVLEHFTDEQIYKICKENTGSVHYVPLDKYVIPSFGDERLLPYQHWLDLVQPTVWFLFNNGHDLAFKV